MDACAVFGSPCKVLMLLSLDLILSSVELTTALYSGVGVMQNNAGRVSHPDRQSIKWEIIWLKKFEGNFPGIHLCRD